MRQRSRSVALLTLLLGGSVGIAGSVAASEPNGRRLFVSMNTAGKIAMLDTSDPRRPRLLSVLDLGADSGPHYIALTRDEKRLVITDYFLNEDDAGKVHAEGDHKVHVAAVSENDLVLDPRFQLDFNTVIATGPARPTGSRSNERRVLSSALVQSLQTSSR